MRVLFAGQKQFGADVLRLVLERGHAVAAVACPVFDGAPDKVHGLALARGLPVIPQAEFCAETMPAGCDLIVAAHFHGYIGPAVRAKTRLGALAYHPSLLPRHRGRDAIEWAIRFGERVTGGTVYWMNDAVDGGPIAAQGHCFIRRDDTALLLWIRELAPMGLRLFDRVLSDVAFGWIAAVPQDEALATWEPGIHGVPRLARDEKPPAKGAAQ